MALLEEIKPLAKIPRSPFPFLTLYLNTRWDSEKQRERVRIFVKTRLREFLSSCGSLNGESRQSLNADAEKVEQYVKGLVNREWDEAYAGIALYACSGLGIYKVLKSFVPFEDTFQCSNRPALRPAVSQLRAGEPAILCMAKGDSGRLLEFELGGLRRQFTFEDEEFPGRHEQGGWSQGRYQRHVEEHLSRNFKRLAENLLKWMDERDVRWLVLSGTDTDLATFEAVLPKRVRQKICARLRIDPASSLDVIAADMECALREAQDREDRQEVDTLLDKSIGSGRAVVGPEPVAQAVGTGKVRVLYLENRLQESGWKCFQCGALGLRVPLGCPLCHLPVDSVELGEELVRDTLASDGRVVALSDHEALRAEGGTAALLRYP